jgi:hypothetical protein
MISYGALLDWSSLRARDRPLNSINHPAREKGHEWACLPLHFTRELEEPTDYLKNLQEVLYDMCWITIHGLRDFASSWGTMTPKVCQVFYWFDWSLQKTNSWFGKESWPLFNMFIVFKGCWNSQKQVKWRESVWPWLSHVYVKLIPLSKLRAHDFRCLPKFAMIFVFKKPSFARSQAPPLHLSKFLDSNPLEHASNITKCPRAHQDFPTKPLIFRETLKITLLWLIVCSKVHIDIIVMNTTFGWECIHAFLYTTVGD